MTAEELKNLFPPRMRVINTTAENGEALLRGETVTDSAGNEITMGENDVIAVPDDTDERIEAEATAREEAVADLQAQIDTVRTTAETAESIAKGANQAISYGNYATLITTLNALPNTTFRVGQNLYIVTVGVPDLWVSEIVDEAVTYTYVSDGVFESDLKEQGYVQVGYYKLSELETQKVNFSEYPTFDNLDERFVEFENTELARAKHEAYYNSMYDMVAVWGDDEGSIVIMPKGELEISSVYFDSSMLKCFVISYGVTFIGDNVFEGCANLTAITLPHSITSIGERSFVGCSSLKNITIPDSVTSIGYQAFDGCERLENIYLPETPPTLGSEEVFAYLPSSAVFHCKTQGSLEAYQSDYYWHSITETYSFVVDEQSE